MEEEDNAADDMSGVELYFDMGRVRAENYHRQSGLVSIKPYLLSTL